jgi:hypothetical protein
MAAVKKKKASPLRSACPSRRHSAADFSRLVIGFGELRMVQFLIFCSNGSNDISLEPQSRLRNSSHSNLKIYNLLRFNFSPPIILFSHIAVTTSPDVL